MSDMISDRNETINMLDTLMRDINDMTAMVAAKLLKEIAGRMLSNGA